MSGTPVVGITGGIACGKSEVGRVLAGAGVAIRDADEVAHEVIEQDSPAYRAIRERFGAGILASDGAIDRGALGARVFANPEERAALNAIVHPAVLRNLHAWRQQKRKEGRPAAVIIPLLFEVGATNGWTAIICVAANQPTVVERLRARGLTEDEARARIGAQMPIEEKMRRSDYVIVNEGTLDELKKKTRAVWEAILNKENR